MMKNALIIMLWLSSFNSFAQKKQVVFVCEHGSVKSVIAANYFNKMAKERNLPYEAVARGTNPNGSISTQAKQLLSSDSSFDSTFVPRKLSQTDVDEAEQVFLFFALPSDVQGKNKERNWLEIQTVNGNFPKLRDDIVKKITPLLDSLSKK